MPYLGSEDTERELRRLCVTPTSSPTPLRYRNTVLKVLRAMSQGVDVSGLFSEMVKACATADIVQKKLVYVFLCSYAALKPRAVSAGHQHAEEGLPGTPTHGAQPGPQEHDQPPVSCCTQGPQTLSGLQD
ncbi:hypothetical protein KUCAC02_011901 [Chaenocephalus aceratus]|uniref:Uncharacterized protein n=1 Tax=Chaenocephalus aceratus TaxID=36190 RepID=A0ACB9X8Z8_CHAAC|nr:hypothetical protein KUCAC02_011901 [Chaenocephalus aceratus]